MTIYRVLKKLDAGGRGMIRPPGPTALQWLNDEQIQRLIDVGAVSELHAPPIEELPGWKTRAKALKRAGVDDVSVFLMADEGELAKKLRKRKPTVSKWKVEMRRLLALEAETEMGRLLGWGEK